MADALDAPTVYTTSAPMLGLPVLSLAYRAGAGEAPHPTLGVSEADLSLWVEALEHRIVTLEAAVRALQRPWSQRAWDAIQSWWEALRA